MTMITISPYILLLVIAALAFIIPLLSSKIGVPAVVGEIVCGILLGASGLTVGEDGKAIIEFLAGFGLVFLMFLVGLEIDFSKVEMHGVKPFIIGAATFAITLGISIAMMCKPGYFGYNLYLALILSSSAVGLTASTIKELGLSKEEYGQTILISAFIADLGTVLLVTIYTMYLTKGLTADIFLIALVFLLFFFVYYVGKLAIWHYPERLSAWFKSDQPSEIGVRAAFALLLVFVALSEIANVEAVLGAFLAGVLLSLLFRGGTILEQKLYGIGYGFLIPIFFINVGMRFEPCALLSGECAYLVPKLLFVALAAKIAPSMLFLSRFSFAESISAGILLSSRLSLIVAMATVGLQLGVIEESIASAVILIAIITSISCPTVFRWMYRHRRHHYHSHGD